MAPVGHGGHGASSPKDKRDQTGQESLYTEDRAWTEALIGGHEPDETPDHAPVTASPPEIDQQLAAALRAAALREALPDETPDHAPVTASPPEIDQQLAAALRAAALREALGY
ncbi:hypothetical protein DSM43519_02524 [Mycobacterium marinum]|nr:hypothetical protein DSM43519_02524 [Mycobacterium marinum]